MGRNLEGKEHIRHAAKILRTHGMKARLSILAEQERQLARVFRQGYRGARKKLL